MPETTQSDTSSRQRLVGAARELFAARGYQDTSVQSVLDAAGVSKGALYHHFASKERLFEAVLQQVEGEIAQRLVSAAGSAVNGADALRAGCSAWLELASDAEIRQIALIDAPTALGWARWREIDHEHGFGLLTDALRNESQTGALAPELVDTHAHILLASLMELGLVIAQAGDPETARHNAHESLERLLDSLIGRDAGR